MLSMIGATTEFKSSINRRRRAEGIALAKDRGVYKGRRCSVTDGRTDSENPVFDGVSLKKGASAARRSTSI